MEIGVRETRDAANGSKDDAVEGERDFVKDAVETKTNNKSEA